MSEIKELLSSPKNIVVLIHKNPDGDALGAGLGLFLFLEKQKHKVKIISPNDYPAFYRWMPGSQNIINDKINHQATVAAFRKAELIFCVDFNAIERIGNVKEEFQKSDAVSVLIDSSPET